MLAAAHKTRQYVLLALLSCVALLASCARSSSEEWVGEAEQAHAVADRAQTPEQRQQAGEALERVLESARSRGLKTEAALAVQQDVYYRLAELALADGKADVALRWTREGLALGEQASVFSANLWISQGRAHEALGDKAAASEAYFEALKVNEVLFERSLGDDPETDEP